MKTRATHPTMTSKTPLPPSFLSKKQKILAQLAVPITEYDDLSPKGSIDEGIRDLIDEINACEGFVTTSSCAGRISVFAEGDKNLKGTEPVDAEEHDVPAIKPAGVGGKGGGGKWLFVSHDPVNLIHSNAEDLVSTLGMEYQSSTSSILPVFSGESDNRLIHFKFEPMVRFNFSLRFSYWLVTVCAMEAFDPPFPYLGQHIQMDVVAG